MTNLELLDRAAAAETAWRRLQAQALEALELALANEADRHSAEQTLRAALMSLGAAVLGRFRQPEQRAQFAAVLDDTAPLARGDEPVAVVPAVLPTPPVFEPVAAALAQVALAPVALAPPIAMPVVSAPAPAQPIAAPPVRVTAEMIDSLATELMSGRGMTRAIGPTAAPEFALEDAGPMLGEVLAALGGPPADVTPGALETEVRRLIGITQAGVAHWGRLAQRANYTLTGWLTARLRHAQELAVRQGLEETLDPPLAGAIRRLSGHSKDTQPGFIHGLALGHLPQHGSWAADSAEWREQAVRLLAECTSPARPIAMNPDDRLRILTERVRAGIDGSALASELKAVLRDGVSPTDKRVVNLARPFADALDGSTLSPLRKAIRDAIEAESEAEGATDVRRQALPADWPLLSETRGRRVLIVGGDPRPERSARLRVAFEFGEVEWLEGNTTRKIDGLKDRMRSGNLDMVIVLRAFNSHKVSDAIFGVKSDACVAILSDGYGITQVRLGLERFLIRAAA